MLLYLVLYQLVFILWVGARYTIVDGLLIVGYIQSFIFAVIHHMLTKIGWFPPEGPFDIRYSTVGFAENTIWARIGRIGRGK